MDKVVSSREEIFTLNLNEHPFHLAFRPSSKDIFGLVETCPKIEVIQLPKSYANTVKTNLKTSGWYFMEYVRKTCPVCGNEFIVLKKVEEKAIYCTLECLSTAQRRMKKENVSSFMSA
ncbi:MAG: DUF1699 family protein [Methanosarcina sp.]|uniref:DUF1699 family protein n=1 Tax=Methanosarcina sp. TaxID=2213 RepID=UPI00261AD616|nr:DUF1699 family protein [Methanosarcina sp.]MDD3248179.1 DUF1699 family protein [Methanosarcina sp.]MDD3248423.1 DUF1699 family protein [Methanosarcina sp.]